MNRTMNTDNVMALINSHRTEAINVTRNGNCLSIKDLIVVDKYCNSSDKSSYKICSTCEVFLRILGSNGIIEYGANRGIKLNIRTIKFVSVPPIIKPCTHKSYMNESLLCCDSLTLEVLISNYLTNIGNNNQILLCSSYYYSYICSKEGRIVQQKLPKLNISSLSAKNIHSMILQLIVMYQLLIPYRFFHGNPILSSLEIIDIPCSYIFGLVTIDCPYTLILSNLNDCTMIINKRRLCSHNQYSASLYSSSFSCNTRQFQSLDDDGYQIQAGNISCLKERHVGAMNVADYHDIYMFLLSMYMNKDIRDKIDTDGQLNILWNKLWGLKEAKYINNKVSKVVSDETGDQEMIMSKILIDIQLRRSNINSILYSR